MGAQYSPQNNFQHRCRNSQPWQCCGNPGDNCDRQKQQRLVLGRHHGISPPIGTNGSLKKILNLIKFLQHNLAISTHLHFPLLIVFDRVKLIQRRIYLFLFHKKSLAAQHICAGQ